MKKLNYFLILMILLMLLFDFFKKDTENMSINFSFQEAQVLSCQLK
jgi:hypothetical protein